MAREGGASAPELGVGVAHAPTIPTAESLTSALDALLRPEVAARARAVGTQVRDDGATVAARRVGAA